MLFLTVQRDNIYISLVNKTIYIFLCCKIEMWNNYNQYPLAVSTTTG